VPRPPPHTIDFAKARRDFDIASSVLLAGVGRDVLTRDTFVDGAAGPLRARVYTPRGASGALPLLVFFHGGGFVLGSLASHDGICRFLCKHSGVRIVAVEYRLAPEHPYPVAVEDALTAFRHVVSDSGRFGGSGPVGVGGDSAGDTIAAVVAQRCADEEGLSFPAAAGEIAHVVDPLGS
jgi:acetyl esterase